MRAGKIRSFLLCPDNARREFVPGRGSGTGSAPLPRRRLPDFPACDRAASVECQLRADQVEGGSRFPRRAEIQHGLTINRVGRMQREGGPGPVLDCGGTNTTSRRCTACSWPCPLLCSWHTVVTRGLGVTGPTRAFGLGPADAFLPRITEAAGEPSAQYCTAGEVPAPRDAALSGRRASAADPGSCASRGRALVGSRALRSVPGADRRGRGRGHAHVG